MTTIITRVFPNAKAAHGAADRLKAKGIPDRQRDVIVAGDDARAFLEHAEVHASAVEPYLKHLKTGKAVLVVRTTYKPLGAASITREVLARRETIPVAKVVDDFFVPDKVDKAPSILKEHPRFLTLPRTTSGGPVTPGLGMSLVKEHKSDRTLVSHDKRYSRMFWPMALVSKKNRSSSVMDGSRRMSRMFWPMPLISRKKHGKSVISGGALPFSRFFGLRTTT